MLWYFLSLQVGLGCTSLLCVCVCVHTYIVYNTLKCILFMECLDHLPRLKSSNKERNQRVSLEVCGCCLPWCLCHCLKCVTLSLGTEEIFVSIDNFTQLRPSTIAGRTCYAVRSFLCWFATAKFNILLISICCHIKRKNIISAVLLKKLK